jgi:hypothetical protein
MYLIMYYIGGGSDFSRGRDKFIFCRPLNKVYLDIGEGKDITRTTL